MAKTIREAVRGATRQQARIRQLASVGLGGQATGIFGAGGPAAGAAMQEAFGAIADPKAKGPINGIFAALKKGDIKALGRLLGKGGGTIAGLAIFMFLDSLLTRLPAAGARKEALGTVEKPGPLAPTAEDVSAPLILSALQEERLAGQVAKNPELLQLLRMMNQPSAGAQDLSVLGPGAPQPGRGLMAF